MNRKIATQRLLALALCITIAFGLSFNSVNGEEEEVTLIDINNHWAKDVILEKQDQGIVKGYEDHTFRPDNTLTRAELMAIINKSFGLTKGKNINYNDLIGNEWYLEDVKKAAYYDYIEGDKVRGNEKATRLDAVMMIGKLINAYDEGITMSKFTDIGAKTHEEQITIHVFGEKGYINGYQDNSFKPDKSLTRAEIMKIINNILGYVVRNESDLKDIDSTRHFQKISVIKGGLHIEGLKMDNLFITPLVSGKVEITDCDIKETVEIGSNTIISFSDTNLKDILINHKEETDYIASNIIINDGNSQVASITIENDTQIRAQENIVINQVVVKKEDIKVSLQNVTVNKLSTHANAKINTNVATMIKETFILEKNSGNNVKGKYPEIGSRVNEHGIESKDGDYIGLWAIEDLACIGNRYTMPLHENYRLMRDLNFNSRDGYRDSNGFIDMNMDGKSDDLNGDGDLMNIMDEFTSEDSFGWNPIGHIRDKEEYGFTGIFDGNNKTLSNLYINRNDEDSNGEGVGFFKLLGSRDEQDKNSTCLVKNLNLINARVNGSSGVGLLAGIGSGDIINVAATGYCKGETNVGGLVGANFGDIVNCYTKVGIVAEENGGGLVGETLGEIKNSYTLGEIEGKDNIGGLAGTSEGNVVNSYFEGNVVGEDTVGGLIGDSAGNITGCYVIGSLEGIEGIENVGGLVGNSDGEISYSYTDISTMGQEVVGGLVGCNENSIEYCYTIKGAAGVQATGGLVGENKGEIRYSYTLGGVSGEEGTGGLAGENSGEILESYSESNIFGGSSTGGLVGENKGEIKDCFAIGDVNGILSIGGIAGINDGDILSCYSTSAVEGDGNVGGIAGEGDGSIMYCIGFNEKLMGGENPRKILGSGENEGIIESYGKSNDVAKDLSNKYPILKDGLPIKSMLPITQKPYTIIGDDSKAIWDFNKVWKVDAGMNRPTLLKVIKQ